jgi:chromosome partitioning protein
LAKKRVLTANGYAIVPRETMSKTVVIANQKGGVAKTTTAVNLAAFLGSFGKSVLLIDLDPQANATSGIGLNREEIQKGIYEVLIEKETLDATVLPSPSQGVSVCPAQISLVGAEVELVYGVRRESRLRQALDRNEHRNRYDFIIIDTPPSLGLLTLNAFTAADSVLIPMQCEYYALEGLAQLYKTIQLVKQKLNPGLSIEGLVFSMVDPRMNLTVQVMEEVRKNFKDKVYESTIPRNVRLAEAPSFGKSILDYDKTSKGAEAYEQLAKEFLARSERTGQSANAPVVDSAINIYPPQPAAEEISKEVSS